MYKCIGLLAATRIELAMGVLWLEEHDLGGFWAFRGEHAEISLTLMGSHSECICDNDEDYWDSSGFNDML